MFNTWEELTGTELHSHKENTGSKAVFQMCQEDRLHFTGFFVCALNTTNLPWSVSPIQDLQLIFYLHA